MRRRSTDYDAETDGVLCTSSGSTMLDLALGGGWANGRVVNIVGDSSSGKTLLAMEAVANYARRASAAYGRYADVENALDEPYGRAIGMPEGISRPQAALRTVQDFHDDIADWIRPELVQASHGLPLPSIYVLDSLDALSAKGEVGREFGEATYGTDKSKDMSELFRRINADIARANCTLMVISQVRDNIGARFGEKRKRAGGRALEFYSSQTVWLSPRGRVKRTVMNAERVTGIDIVASVRKNKIAPPFRDVMLTIMFNYGIDDEQSISDWLKMVKSPRADGLMTQVVRARGRHDIDQLDMLSRELREIAVDQWTRIETALQPPVRKYR